MKTSVSNFGKIEQPMATSDMLIDSLTYRNVRFTLSRDELLTLPEFVLLSLFPNGLLPDGHATTNGFHDGEVYPVDVSEVISRNSGECIIDASHLV